MNITTKPYPKLINLKTSVAREKDVQDIGIHREF